VIDVARKPYVRRCAVPLLGAVILVSFVSCDPSVRTAGAGGGAGAAQGGSLPRIAIDGNATEPISPGVKVPLDLEFTNPHGFPISVTDLSVTVKKVSAPNADDIHPCAVGDFAVDQVSSTLDIKVDAGATSTLSSLDVGRAMWPHVGLLDRSVDQDGCKGASLTLAYAAGAVGN
jgi:hypothetical protein